MCDVCKGCYACTLACQLVYTTLVFIVTGMAKTSALEDFRFVVLMGCLPSSYLEMVYYFLVNWIFQSLVESEHKNTQEEGSQWYATLYIYVRRIIRLTCLGYSIECRINDPKDFRNEGPRIRWWPKSSLTIQECPHPICPTHCKA